MGVQSEISRLENAKAQIAQAITQKGVSVPDGTKLDGMSALIEQIETADIAGLKFSRKDDGSISMAYDESKVSVWQL